MDYSQKTLAAFSATLAAIHEANPARADTAEIIASTLRGLFPRCEISFYPRATAADDRRGNPACGPVLSLVLGAGGAGRVVVVRRSRPFTDRERYLATQLQEHLSGVDRHRRRTGTRKHERASAPFRPLPELTGRENEVLRWVVAGKRNAEISSLVGAAPRTIGKHVENILRKLHVENRGAAVLLAIESADALRLKPAGSGREPWD
jgi:DNA-binding CsgD family transcriptional regulator